MNTIRPIAWEVWLANVRFEDVPETKKRPVVVTETGEAFIIALKVTSHEPRDAWGEYALMEWRTAGLKKQSTVRISKRLRLPKTALVHRIGVLHQADILAIRTIIASK